MTDADLDIEKRKQRAQVINVNYSFRPGKNDRR
jgi:hypothetical protein